MKAIMERTLDVLWPTRPSDDAEIPARVVPAIANMARLTCASVLAFLLTRWLVHGPTDLTSALTALLVMKASATGSFKNGLLRVVAVSSGVGLALLTAGWLGMHWWSLGLVIFCALFLARILRLGDASFEMPISAMLILGSGRGDVAAETRIISTLIGTMVGVVFPLVFPTAVPFRSASAVVRRIAADQRDLLHQAAEAFETDQVTRPVVGAWVDRSRALTAELSTANRQVASLSDVRRFNSRAVGTADISPILTSGLNTLESCLVSLRGLLLLMERHAPAPVHPSAGLGRPEQPFDLDVQHAVGLMLRRLGDCLAAFGRMVEAEANGNEEEAQQVFVTNYRALRDARAELAELMAAADQLGEQWLLGGGILSGLDQLLAQLDLDARLRVRHRWKASQLGRRLTEGQIGPRSTAMDRLRHARMRTRALRHRAQPETEADFLGDEETTQTIPRIDAERLAELDAERQRRRRLRIPGGQRR